MEGATTISTLEFGEKIIVNMYNESLIVNYTAFIIRQNNDKRPATNHMIEIKW